MNSPENILIVRSVSFQHLDWVLTVVQDRWPESRICLLTHAHGQDTALSTAGVDEVLVYPSDGDFSLWKILKRGGIGGGYDHLVVPFSNCSGAGFGNVIAMAFGISASKRWLLPLNGKLKALRQSWWLSVPLRFLLILSSFLLSVMMLPLLCVLLGVHLAQNRFGLLKGKRPRRPKNA